MADVSFQAPAPPAVRAGSPWAVVVQGAATLAVGMGAAILAAVLGVVAWTLRPEPAGEPTSLQRQGDVPRTHRWFAALLASYSLEGVGYIIAGTFLVAAISQNSPGWLGGGAWVVVGIAATPASAMWAYLAQRRSSRSRRWPSPSARTCSFPVRWRSSRPGTASARSSGRWW
ncbi:MAG TPA: YbfB/YjiJ family MFS transporter [Trebonia sp.]